MKIFPNNSVGVSQFGYALLGLAAVGSVVFFITFPSDYVIQYFNGSVAVTGLVAITVAKALKNLEDRLDNIESKRR
jgi:hypothetical protein